MILRANDRRSLGVLTLVWWLVTADLAYLFVWAPPRRALERGLLVVVLIGMSLLTAITTHATVQSFRRD